MKASLFYVVIFTIFAGIAWSVWDYRTGVVPVSDTESMKTVTPAPGDTTLHPFAMDKYEVTNGQYWRFDHSREFLPAEVDFPVTRVTWFEANEYAEWAKKRLPTAAEWTYASNARKNDFALWNDIALPAVKVKDEGYKLFRVGAFWRDKAPLGMMDMSGNAWEWTADTLRLNDGRLAAIIKGGFTLKDGALNFTRHTVQDTVPVDTRSPQIGFRCVRDK